MKGHFHYFIRSAIDWLFRRRSPALGAMRIGLGCVALAFGAGWILDVSLPFREGRFNLSINSSGGTPSVIVYATTLLGLALICIGLAWELNRYRTEQRRVARRKVIVVEVRGLRDMSGCPLAAAVPETLEGLRDQVSVDLRQGVEDGIIIDPSAAVERLISLPVDLKRRESGLDRRDITYVYGGLAPVPLTFLTGVLMDDESSVAIMDWDRHAGRWRILDGDDDGKRFKITGLETVQAGSEDAVLAVSVSYGVDLNGVRHKIGGMPVVQMELESGSPDCHWSDDKQKALGKQFLETVIALGNRGVRRVHLFLAAQNSVVFRFGRLYDKRNLPEVVVYQYQREQSPPYPWGVHMPVSGVARPEVV